MKKIAWIKYLGIESLILVFFISIASAQADISSDYNMDLAAQGATLFNRHCSSCHDISNSSIGPKLGGVTLGRSRQELIVFTQNPQAFIDNQDSRTLALFSTYRMVMPGFSYLQHSELEAIFSFVHQQTLLKQESFAKVEITRYQEKKLAPSILPSNIVIQLMPFISLPRAPNSPADKGIATLRSAPDKSKDVFVSDQSGVIYRIHKGKYSVYLDLREKIPDFVSEPGIGTGLGSFDFHPQFKKNGLLYTTHAENYKGKKAINDGFLPEEIGVGLQWVISEWRHQLPLSDTFKGEHREVLRINTPTTAHGMQDLSFNHNIKTNHSDFGLIFLGIGDGGSNNIKKPALCGRADSLLGTVIRINPLGKNSSTGQYGIPEDNPFVNSHDQSIHKEIYAYGFRNPHRLTWETTTPNRLLVADVGEANIEELNLIQAGGYYGWPRFEGGYSIDTTISLTKVVAVKQQPTNHQLPFAAYDHNEGHAISGGFIYQGPISALKNKYIFGDIVTGRLFYLDILNNNSQIYELNLSIENKSTSMRELTHERRVHLRIGYDFIGKKLFIFSKNGNQIWQVKDATPPWEPLFNQKDLQGWIIVDPPAKVSFENGEIILQMTNHTARHAFLRTTQKYKDFIFEVNYSRDLTMDSGILFRATDAPDFAYSGLFGYMLKIDSRTTRKWTGGIFCDYGNGFEWLHTLENNEAGRNAELPAGSWNHLRIEAIGNTIKAWVNHVPTAHIKDNRYTKGYIAFKIHFLRNDETKTNLQIRLKDPKIMTKHIKKYSLPTNLPLIDRRGYSAIQQFR